jgi:hypothetical protein
MQILKTKKYKIAVAGGSKRGGFDFPEEESTMRN